MAGSKGSQLRNFPLRKLLVQFSTQFLIYKRIRFWSICLFGIALLAIAPIVEPVHGFLSRPEGSSVLYGKIADTRNWAGITGDSLIKNARVSINSLPTQITYTDANGQFWFQNLRNISYSINVDDPSQSDRHYSFRIKVDGTTGSFFDLAAEERHNLEEMDY